ncbi:MAG: amino acid ABC transporter substrate-binding protein [Acutalibacteraceae bacterium]|nr:amino acid ABC transporter substrate-binding protein [Oscillospiraceae bacterium]
MNKKIIAAVLAVITALTAIVFTACSGKGEGDKEETKTFTVGLDATFAPYGYQDDNGEIVGFDIDLAKEVAKRNGWEFKAQPIKWAAKDAELKSGTIDCIWNGFTINGRENDYTWSDPYVDNSQVVVVKKDSGITKLSDLAGKTVIAQQESSAEKALKDEEDERMKSLLASFKQLDLVDEYDIAFANLDAGAADAIAMDIGVAQYKIKARGEDKYMILDEQIAAEQYGIGFKLGNTELRDAVQKTLDEMMADGTFKQIAETWGLEQAIITK